MDEICAIEKVALAPDDILVVRVGEHISKEQSDYLERRVRQDMGGAGNRIMVLSGGMSLEVVSKT